MNKFVKIAIGIVIIIAVPKLIQKLMLGDPKEKANRELAKLVGEMNAQTPRKVDDLTTLNRVDFDGKVFRVNYTMSDEVTLDPAMRAKYEDLAAKQVCGSAMRAVLKYDITVEYLYNYTDGGVGQTMRISVPPGKCA